MTGLTVLLQMRMGVGLLLLEPVQGLLRRGHTEGLGVRGQARLGVHGRVAKVHHGVHVALEALQREVGIAQLTDGIGAAGEQIGGALRREMGGGKSAEGIPRGEADQGGSSGGGGGGRGGGGHFAQVRGLGGSGEVGLGLRMTAEERGVGGQAGGGGGGAAHGRGLQLMMGMLLRMGILLGGPLLVKGVTPIAHHLGW
jgi:hypothetical protein